MFWNNKKHALSCKWGCQRRWRYTCTSGTPAQYTFTWANQPSRHIRGNSECGFAVLFSLICTLDAFVNAVCALQSCALASETVERKNVATWPRFSERVLNELPQCMLRPPPHFIFRAGLLWIKTLGSGPNSYTHTQSSDVFCFYNNRQTANEWTERSWCHCDVTAQCHVKTCLAPDFFCAELHAGASWVHGCVPLSCCFISSCGQRSEVLRLFHVRVLALCCGEGQTSFPFLCSSARVHPDCLTDLSLTSGSPHTKVMIIILW